MTNKESSCAATEAATKCVQHINSLPGVQAEIILTINPGDCKEETTAPVVKIDFSRVWETSTSPWCAPKLVEDHPISQQVVEAVVQLGKAARIEQVVIHRDGDDNLLAVEALLNAIPADHLQRISLQMYKASDQQATLLGRFTKLTHVNLAHCSQITNAGLAAGLGPASKTIQSLNLRSTQLNDEGLQLLSEMINLQDLNLDYTKIRLGTGLAHLQKLPHLQRLKWSVNGNSGETNVVTLEALKVGFPALNAIHFSANTIHDQHLACLACCSSLEKLVISTVGSTDITDNGLKPVGENLTNLKVLSLNGSFQVTDRGIAHLQTLQELEYLDAGRTKTNPQSLETTFMGLPKLQVLDIHGTGIAHGSKDSLNKLQTHNPRLHIILDYMADAGRSDGARVYGKQESGFNASDYLD